MLKKKLKWMLAPVFAIALITGLSSFTGEGETAQTGQCNLCVVKQGQSILFSCKPVANSSCSKSQSGVQHPEHGTITISVSCANAKAC